MMKNFALQFGFIFLALFLLAGCGMSNLTVGAATPVLTEVIPTETATTTATVEAVITAMPTAPVIPPAIPTQNFPPIVLPFVATGEAANIGAYDLSIPYYVEVFGSNPTAFIEAVVEVDSVDPRLAFLTNNTVEEVFYTSNAPVHNINGEDYMAVYRKRYVISENLNDSANDSAVMYVRKSDIKPALAVTHPAEVFLRNRILQDSSSFVPVKMKSKNDVYRVSIMYYILPEVTLKKVCKDDGNYGVVDMLVYVPGKGLRKHGLAIYHQANDGTQENLYIYGIDLVDNGAEARILATQFSFSNKSDFLQGFNYQDWVNNTTELGNFSYFTSSWNTEESIAAFNHMDCFAKGYEQFLKTQGDQYTVFLAAEQFGSSAFHDSPNFPITPDELKAIWQAAGRGENGEYIPDGWND